MRICPTPERCFALVTFSSTSNIHRSYRPVLLADKSFHFRSQLCHSVCVWHTRTESQRKQLPCLLCCYSETHAAVLSLHPDQTLVELSRHSCTLCNVLLAELDHHHHHNSDCFSLINHLIIRLMTLDINCCLADRMTIKKRWICIT